MFEHINEKPKKPKRVVVIGARGFIGSELTNYLKSEKVKYLPIFSSEIDLSIPDSVSRLNNILNDSDSVVFLSAITPDKGRDLATFEKNINMALNVSKAIKDKSIEHFVYLSSDAVYPFDNKITTESTPAAPEDLYGVMHRSREIIFQSTVKINNLTILRPTLIYGKKDTHNSYGANRFRRTAQSEKKIVLFGQGEETRDHVYVSDLVKLITLVLFNKSIGLLNIVSGQSVSFSELALKVARLQTQEITITNTDRVNEITHRKYDNTLLKKAFPEFQFIKLDDGLALSQ